LRDPYDYKKTSADDEMQARVAAERREAPVRSQVEEGEQETQQDRPQQQDQEEGSPAFSSDAQVAGAPVPQL
jgi:hypothetical protein